MSGYTAADDVRLGRELRQLRDRKIPRRRDDAVTTVARRVENMAASGGGVSARDFERYVGRNDLLRINYLTRGMLAARAVCRLNVAAVVGGSWGTGFLVGPRLLLTNHHVIGSAEEAARTVAEFGYEADQNGFLPQGKRFRCAPQLGFVTDPELDFTLVALDDRAEDGGTALSGYGFLRLSPKLHKVDEEEYVTIIQHPNGEEKYIAIRENRVLKIGDEAGGVPDNWLWYASDTAPGSSGAPAFNDQWQVVAVHHRSVRKSREAAGAVEYQLVGGEWIGEAQAQLLPDERFNWIANEGVRVSKIIAGIAASFAAQPPPPLIRDFLDDASGVRPFVGTVPNESIVAPALLASPGSADTAEAELERRRQPRRNVRPANYYAGRQGYDPAFLTDPLPLPQLTPGALHFGQQARVPGTVDDVLRYTHFSVVFNETRRLAFLTAVNIDGKESFPLERGDDNWFYDPRLPLAVQVDDEFYGNEPVEPRRNWFDRGHLVRRLDPVWGPTQVAGLANEDTFHWTNCSPQYWAFNQGKELWQGLENFILSNTDNDDLRATVFTGPVFRDDDEAHRGILVPQFYWKVVVVRDASRLYSSAYVVSQERFARNIPFEALPVGRFKNFQVTIAKLEQLTGLAFAQAIRDAEVYAGADRPLRGVGDIVHPRRQR